MAIFNQTHDIPTAQTNSATDNKRTLAQERWQAILQYKQAFLQNNVEDLCRYPFMNQDVVASWLRSRKMGVNPYSVIGHSNLNQEKLSEIMDKYHLLIKVTNSLIENFKDMFLSCGDILYLFDKTRIVLLNEGSWENSPLFPENHPRTGIVSDEHSEGTTAHELCIRLERPVQLLGPEHYCVAFQSCIASAAPIRDENDKVNAALVLLNRPLQEPPGEEVLEKMCLHSLGLVTSLATAIETQFKLAKVTNDFCDASEQAETFNCHFQIAMDRFATVRNALNTTLAIVNEGIIVTNRVGKIIHINKEGMRILKLRPDQIENRNINDFLSIDSSIMTLVEKGEIVTTKECICGGTDGQLHQVCIRPAFNPYTQKLDIVVFKLNSSEKIIAKINNRSGSLTNNTFEHLVGDNFEFKKSVVMARRFASTADNILLIGESGTGKELFAQAIHNIYRPQSPFIAVNCAAMPSQLIESEMFGYEGGSFTGAERSGRPGKIELAHGGTLFLDEIGDMPIELQAVLLRTLEDKQVMRIGGRRYKQVDFRLISATNKNLYQMVTEKKFRGDLFFRLAVLPIKIPPLRERGCDIEILSKFFIGKYCHKQGWKVPQISPAAQKIINQYEWPGNARQLQNAMIYAVNTSMDGIIKPDNLPSYIPLATCPIKIDGMAITSNEKIGDMLCLEKMEKSAIETALAYANNCVPNAAELLGISRSTLYRKLKEYNIDY
ncbi:transcriptional regulator with PAS [Sporomusaceae bacterium BoRhaA]|uniref:sigma-54 interaction domain-containing protein n=1 Tax=Pelorhabdus rhamnosifermentans TaxID=2772457 RepID=UPI001C05FC5A|nr:sigma 54-interacting transcriptional regulator [Pelorhabdus rhamnosifermentans]MBU2702346.1 transcriptional regulator with PAS [Pelorhabdus rhamnosifermentans]